jgi:hypothetical protein
MEDAKKGELTFPDWSPDHFDACRLWIYGEDGSGVTMENVVELWHMTNFLLLESFQLHLIAFISESNPTVEEALQLLSLLNDEAVANIDELREALCLSLFQTDDFYQRVRVAGVLTGENCALEVFSFLLACARERPIWMESMEKGESELLDLCCNWLATHKNYDMAEDALSLLVLEIFAVDQLYHTLMHHGIPRNSVSTLNAGGHHQSFGRASLEKAITDLNSLPLEGGKCISSWLDHSLFFGHEVHV